MNEYLEYSTFNAGPLTTTFTPPSQCFSTSWQELSLPTSTDSTDLLRLGYYSYPLDVTCYPSATVSASLSYLLGHGRVAMVYSPGAICPQGLTTACKVTRGLQVTSDLYDTAAWPMWSLLKTGETAYGCCPSAFACDAILSICTPTQSSTTGPMVLSDSNRGSTTITGSITLNHGGRINLITSGPATPSTRHRLGIHTDSLPFGAEIAIAVVAPLVIMSIVLGAFLLCSRWLNISHPAASFTAESKNVGLPLMERDGNQTQEERALSKPQGVVLMEEGSERRLSSTSLSSVRYRQRRSSM